MSTPATFSGHGPDKVVAEARKISIDFLRSYYHKLSTEAENLWTCYTLGSWFAHTGGANEASPLSPVCARDRSILENDLKAVIEGLGYQDCRPIVKSFDVTGDINNIGLMIFVSGIMEKVGSSPMNFSQTFLLKKEILHGVQTETIVIEQDILRYTSETASTANTVPSTSISGQKKVGGGVSTGGSEAVVVSGSGEEAVSSAPTTNVKKVEEPVSFREEKEESGESGVEDDQDLDQDQEEEEEVEMNSTPKELTPEVSKSNKGGDREKKNHNKNNKKKNNKNNKKKEGKEGANAKSNSTEETKVNPTVSDSSATDVAQKKPKSFLDAVGRNTTSSTSSLSASQTSNLKTSKKASSSTTTPSTDSESNGNNHGGKENEGGSTGKQNSQPTEAAIGATSTSTKSKPQTQLQNGGEDSDGFKSRGKAKKQKEQTDTSGNGKTTTIGNNNGASQQDIRSVHIKLTETEWTAEEIVPQLSEIMSQFGNVEKVTSHYPNFAFVDFSDSKAVKSALESTKEFPDFTIHEKTPRRGGNGKNGDRKNRNNNNNNNNNNSSKDGGQQKGGNGGNNGNNGQGGNKRGTGNGNKFRGTNNQKSTN